MVHVVVVRIFNPDPERLTSLSMCVVIPLESAKDLEYHTQDSTCYWLNRRFNIQHWYLKDTVFDSSTHVDVTDHVTYT